MRQIKFLGAFGMAAILAALIMFTGCNKAEATLSGIKISSTAETIQVGSTVTLSYTTEPADAKVESAEWTSSAESVAKVDLNGVVTGLAEGVATITITVNGKFTAICTVTVEKATLVPGEFSVSANKKVKFALGNLQATCTAAGKEGKSTYSWGFAEHQYEFVGNTAGNTTIADQTLNSKVDLFGWVGESSITLTGEATKYGISVSMTYADYGNDATDALKADWCDIASLPSVSGRKWETLTSSEWKYLLESRAGVIVGSTTDARCAEVKVCGICGLLIFPDTFTWPAGITTAQPTTFNDKEANWNSVDYSDAEFTLLEEAGCAFLPAAGYRGGSAVYSAGSIANYWSSTPQDTSKAYYLMFSTNIIQTTRDHSRNFGGSVRLVSVAQ